VYAARIPGARHDHREQSRWAYRLLEMALQKEYPKICTPVLVQKNNEGKPFLKEYPRIHISISHSGAYVACALGEKSVGVDVEAWKKRSKQERIVEKLHPLERELFYGTEEAEKEEVFYGLWVLKESFLKAEGSGLRIPLSAFRVYVVPGITKRVDQTLHEHTYYTRLYAVEEEGVSLAVCTEEPELAERPFWIAFPESV